MIERVDLVAGGLKVKWHALGWKELIKEFGSNSIGSEMLELETT
jgi:site-specific DNA recombinase